MTKPTTAMMPVAASPASQTLSEQAVQQHGHGHRGGHFEPDPPEPQGPHVGHGLGQDPLQGSAAAVQDRVLGVVPGKEVEGGLGRGQYGRKAEEDQRHAGQDQWGH